MGFNVIIARVRDILLTSENTTKREKGMDNEEQLTHEEDSNSYDVLLMATTNAEDDTVQTSSMMFYIYYGFHCCHSNIDYICELIFGHVIWK